MRGARIRKCCRMACPKEGKLTFAKTIADAVKDADFIQESVPERLDLKHRVLAEIDLHAPANSIVGSSTSGIKPSDMQVAMKKHPERLVVGHPFNPVYLLPLVEIVGGQQTFPEAIEVAKEIYASIGMKPVVIRKEIEAFVGDRILEAAWREALWLIKDGICTVEELDDIMRYLVRHPLGADGHVPGLSRRRRRGRHAPLHGAVRAVPEMAVDQADGRAGSSTTNWST